MLKKNKRRPQEEEVQVEQNRKERVSVWTLSHHQNLPSTLDFEWPTYNTEKERIKLNTKISQGLSVSEAMLGYKSSSVDIPDTPQSLRLGDVVNVRLGHISKGNVEFLGLSTKETLVCKNNLYRYEKFRHFIPLDEVRAKIVHVDKKQTTLDVFEPMFDEWLNPILKDPTVQCVVADPQYVKVTNLQLTKGGYVGKVSVPSIERFIGEPYYVDAFIPGSQIVLNIEKDFEKWVSKSVDAFVVGYTSRPNSNGNGMSIVCSVKSYLAFQGDVNLIDLYKHYCEEDDVWKNTTGMILDGVVTGVINTSRKCGVFVEIPDKHITGMVSMEPEKLVEFKPYQEVRVRTVGFEDLSYFDQTSGQRLHTQPYDVQDGVIKSCALKPIFELA